MANFDSAEVSKAMGMAPDVIEKLLKGGGGTNLSQLKQTAMKMMQNKDTARRVRKAIKKIGGKEITKTVMDLADDADDEPEVKTEGGVDQPAKKKKKKNKKKGLKALGALFNQGDAKDGEGGLNADKLKDISTGFLKKMKNMDKETFDTLTELGTTAMESHPELVETVKNIAKDIVPKDDDEDSDEDDSHQEMVTKVLFPMASLTGTATAPVVEGGEKKKRRKRRRKPKLK